MAHDLMKLENKVYLDKSGIIHSIHRGVQTAYALHQSRDRIQCIMDTLIVQDKPILLLVDIRNSTHQNQASRITALHSRTILPFWKAAFVVTREIKEYELVSRKLSKMTGRKKEIRYFHLEEDAMEWLSDK